ncbi:MAG: lipopolysaccharide biosynthesis protein [Lachnospiraceae bacterium]|nr:lipopolysaccharide biosynthesis protein [Lachnospiraceae bacterium]
MKSQIIVKNFAWRLFERTGAQGVAFVVSIILARILEPEYYGTIALITVFITIMNVFVDSGLGNALIQKKDADSLDFSTVFFFNLFVCTVLYIVAFLSAPLIAWFYKDNELVPLIRVLSVTILISGIKNIQQAYVSRNMLFHKFFFATLGGTLAAALAGIALAYLGYGVWALAAQQIVNVLIDTIVLWVLVKWRPTRQFSPRRLKELLSYGWKLLVSSLLDAVYNNIRQLLIGKLYSSSDLAFYNRGRQFPHFFVSNINNSIDSVLLPAMSSGQDDKRQMKRMTRRAIKMSTYLMAPLMMGLAACADTIIPLALTEKWSPCIPFLRIFCITFMFHPIHTANLNAIKAMGRSDLFLRLEVIKKALGIVILVSTMWFGVMVMAYSLLFYSVLGQIINSWPNKKLLDYGYLEQLKDISPGILLSVLMAGGVYVMQFISLPIGLILTLQIMAGAVFYMGMSWLLRLESFEYLLGMTQGFLRKRR